LDTAANFYSESKVIYKIDVDTDINNWLIIDKYSAFNEEKEILINAGSYMVTYNVEYKTVLKKYETARNDTIKGDYINIKMIHCKLFKNLESAIRYSSSITNDVVILGKRRENNQTGGKLIENDSYSKHSDNNIYNSGTIIFPYRTFSNNISMISTYYDIYESLIKVDPTIFQQLVTKYSDQNAMIKLNSTPKEKYLATPLIKYYEPPLEKNISTNNRPINIVPVIIN
jgi:hypothetical protein